MRGIFSRVALVLATHFMPGFHYGLLRNVTTQLFAQFLRVVGVGNGTRDRRHDYPWPRETEAYASREL